MKLYDGGRASNPRRVTIFLKEKGLTVPTVPVDMAALGHRAPDVTRLNPFQRLPVLALDDGTVITESVAICRYLEELHPDPPLFGHDALEKALVEMWNRRVELIYFAAVAAAFRHLHPAMAGWEVPQVPEWGQVNKPKALDFLVFLDGELANRCCIAGERFSIADITMLVAFDLMKPARITCPPELTHVWRWYRETSSRPSAAIVGA